MDFPSSSSTFFQIQTQVEEDEQFNITQEELFAFHEVDRQLFSKLVFEMSRDPKEAVQFTAFWLLLERLEKAQFVAALLKFSDNIFKKVVEETLLCLKATEFNYPVTCFDDIPLVRRITGKNKDQLNLRVIHENRANIILGVDYFIKNICFRVFHDLIRIASEKRSINQPPIDHQQPPPNRPKPFSLFHFSPHASAVRARSSGKTAEGLNSTSETQTQRRFPPFYELENVENGLGKDVVVGDFSVPLRRDHFNVSNQNCSFQVGGASTSASASSSSYDPMFHKINFGFEIKPQIQQRNNNVSDQFNELSFRKHSEFQRSEEKPYIIPSDERAIFEERPYIFPSERTIFGEKPHIFTIERRIFEEKPYNFPSERTIFEEKPYIQPSERMIFEEKPYILQGERIIFQGKSYILPSERTIFLTFSKGYPVLEYEVRDFFTRNYGDIIEALYFQEVGKNEQALYAKLVVRDEMAMVIVLGETLRARFSINGKHVWARKYVFKNNYYHHSPSSSFFN